jgi:hypothetical protein
MAALLYSAQGAAVSEMIASESIANRPACCEPIDGLIELDGGSLNGKEPPPNKR